MSTQTLLLVLLAMTVVTYGTRLVGLAAMRYVPLTPWVTDFLSGMANTVLVALVIPLMINGDWAMRVGGAVAVAVMAVTRNNLLSITAGVGAVALFRALT